MAALLVLESRLGTFKARCALSPPRALPSKKIFSFISFGYITLQTNLFLIS
jgi:hypothetical protein